MNPEYMKNINKLAFFTPLPPAPSGIADFSARLLNDITKSTDVHVYTNRISYTAENRKRYQSLKVIDGVIPASELEQYDLIIYQIGSHRMHAAIYLQSLLTPGIIMLHETMLHQLVKFITFGIGFEDDYRAELEFAYGSEGREVARLVKTGRAASDTLFFNYPLFERIVSRSYGVITTTEFSKRLVAVKFPGKMVMHSPISVELPDAQRFNSKVVQKSGSKADFLVGVFGLITPVKEIDLLIDVFREIGDPRIKLCLVGGVDLNYNLESKLNEAGNPENIIVTGRLPRDEFDEWLDAVDICVNLRYPSGGESSAALLEMMAAGKAVIVPDYAQFLEFPDDCVIKLPLGRDKREMLISMIKECCANPADLKTTGNAARKHVAEHYSPEIVVEKFLNTVAILQDAKKESIGELADDERERYKTLFNEVLKHKDAEEWV